MPTWPGNHTTSPGCSAFIGTFGKDPNCASELCGSDTPADAHAAIVRPEQSKTLGPAPAYWYGLPSWACANATAIAPRPLAGGSFLGSNVVEPLCGRGACDA